MQWYYEKDQTQQGPVEESELRALHDAGVITSSNLVWCRDMGEWATYGSVFSAAESARATPSSPVSGTGGQTPNSELRAQARRALSGSWGMAALAVFLWQVVQGAAGLVPLLGPLAQLAIGGAMMVGLYGFFSTLQRTGVADIGVLFQGFSQFWPAMGIYLLTALIVFLVSLLSAGPGIGLLIYLNETAIGPPEEHPLFLVGILLIVVPLILVSTVMMLRYSMVYLIARDQPELGVLGTIGASVTMMKGRKWKLFFLGLSFIGWHLLGFMALFIGLFWSSAYMFAAFAAFYDDLKES